MGLLAGSFELPFHLSKDHKMSFFTFNDDKSKKQVAVANVYITNTKLQNAENKARFYEVWGRAAESRVDHVGEVSVQS